MTDITAPGGTIPTRGSTMDPAPAIDRSRDHGGPRLSPLPPYPNGWFPVCPSSDLPRGGLRALRFCGSEIVAFRGEDGVAHVIDAHCPHLGAHLGHGGRVLGDTVECPFHGWRIDGTGRCTAIPLDRKIPANARTRAWPTRDVNGIVFAYHHVGG